MAVVAKVTEAIDWVPTKPEAIKAVLLSDGARVTNPAWLVAVMVIGAGVIDAETVAVVLASV